MLSLNSTQVGTKGPGLLLLHGLNESLDGYQRVMGELDDSLRMYAIDLRGHGNSPWRQPYGLVDYMDDVVEFIQDEIGRPVILNGHSLGGLISAGIAAMHPGLVEAVIFEDPPFYTAQLPVLKLSPLYELFTSIRRLLVDHHENRGEMDDLLQLVGKWQVGGPESQKLMEAYGENYVKQLAMDLHRTDPSTLDSVLDGSLFDGFDIDTILSEISCPVLLIAGNNQHGGALREQDIDRVGTLVEDVEIIELSEAGHDIHTTRPKWFADALRDFLSAIEMLA